MPKNVDQELRNRALDSIEAPCSFREQRALRALFERTDFGSHESKSLAILEEVSRLGLVPFQSPAALPTIQLADIHLICWMAIERVEGTSK
jgi:hypothetical protein